MGIQGKRVASGTRLAAATKDVSKPSALQFQRQSPTWRLRRCGVADDLRGRHFLACNHHVRPHSPVIVCYAFGSHSQYSRHRLILCDHCLCTHTPTSSRSDVTLTSADTPGLRITSVEYAFALRLYRIQVTISPYLLTGVYASMTVLYVKFILAT